MKSPLLSFLILLIVTTLSAQLESHFDFSTYGRRVCMVDVTIDRIQPAVTLNFLDASLNQSESFSVYRRQMYGSGADWVLQVENLPPGTTQWTDTDVNLGEIWEYQVRRRYNAGANGVAYGYTCASILHDQSKYRGQVILVIADNVANGLPEEIHRLKKDMTCDGWYVNELVVGAGNSNLDHGNSVVDVKEQIDGIYDNAPEEDKPKVLYILGNVPLPRSGLGLQPPDDHIEEAGARGADCYYADLDGVFTDTATYSKSNQNYTLIKNVPGDFKWDQDKIPSTLEMAFGRVNFRSIGLESNDEELEVTKGYLDRLHDHRYIKDGNKIGINTGFNWWGYDPAVDASFRCLPSISGAENVKVGDIRTGGQHNGWVRDNGPFLWYMSNANVPALGGWRDIGMDALVYTSYQSYYGYGDIPAFNIEDAWHPSTIRRILSYDTKCLITIWTVPTINVFHQVGVGEPLGYACKFIMDHNPSNLNYQKYTQNYDNTNWWNRTHFNFFGDPTLTLYQTFPPSDLIVLDNTNGATLEWTASSDENLIGYHVYKSDDELGMYQKLTGPDPITETQFNDQSYTAGDWYMVRAVAEQTTGSGVFLHPSQGIIALGDNLVSIKSPELNSKFQIAPNPTNGELNITSDELIDRIEIRDNLGRLIFHQNVQPSSYQKIEMHEFEIGVYHVLVYSGKQRGAKRVVKF